MTDIEKDENDDEKGAHEEAVRRSKTTKLHQKLGNLYKTVTNLAKHKYIPSKLLTGNRISLGKVKGKKTRKETSRLSHNKKNRINSPKEQANYILPIGPITSIYEKIYDCSCFFIHCAKHNKICILKTPQSSFIFIPFVIRSPLSSWTKNARDCIALILSNDSTTRYEYLKKYPPYDYLQLLEILRLQVPQTSRFVLRHSFYVRINVTNLDKYFTCCTTSKRLSWLDMNYVQQGLVENIWGPELVEFCQKYHKIQKSTNEFALLQRIIEFGSNQVFKFNPSAEPKNLEESLLQSMKITENDIERLYNDFLEHCYPSFYMTFESFRQYISHTNIEIAEFNLKRLFNAFNYMMNGFLSFHELLLGLVSLEMDTPHDEVRIKFVFRYYDIKKHGYLCEDDLKRLVRDLASQKEPGKVLSEDELNRRTAETMRIFLGNKNVPENERLISYKRFLTTIANHEFRGSSLLCRSRKSVFVFIAKRMANQNVIQTEKILKSVITKKFYPETCKTCIKKKYKLVPFLSVLNAKGNFEKAELVSIQDTFGAPWDSATFYTVEMLDNTLFLQQNNSANFFYQKIRDYNQKKQQLRFGFMSAPNERDKFFQMFQLLINDLEILLKAEPRVKYIKSPCFVIGDIHGNLEDLMSLETCIWKQFPCISVNYLFLGDYVDRGRWSIECALYLFSLKVLMPNMITLLRGNHEIREIQMKYTYKRELLSKYDNNMGQKIFDLTNKVFDRLPLCAIIDHTIYCAHGGIPHEVLSVKEMESKIPPVVMCPEIDSIIAWEIMWSDPISNEHYNLATSMYKFFDDKLKEGYIHNTKRGTAFYFNEKAADNFFRKNNLTHIIRAHEVPKMGFMFHFQHKCITIFSCSHYCGNENDCGVLFIDNGRIRIIRIDTLSNESATDSN